MCYQDPGTTSQEIGNKVGGNLVQNTLEIQAEIVIASALSFPPLRHAPAANSAPSEC